MKITHVPRSVSSVMAFSLFTDTHDESFDPTEMLKRYPMTLTRLEDWVRKQNATQPSAAGSLPTN